MKELWKQRLKEKVQAAELRRTGGTPEQASFHSRAYHRNFEGYSEVRELNEAGRVVTRRIYTGRYYEPELSDFHRLTLRLFYLLFFIGGTALYLFCATRDLICNTALYVALFQAISIPLLIWCVYVLIFYLPSTGRLTIGEYHTQHDSLVRAARWTGVCMWASAVAALLCTFLHFGADTLRSLLCSGGFAVSGGLIFLISVFESHLNYRVIGSDTDAPPDSVEINCD